ncbi:MAG: 4a-hydroxytetrahydrobiopterin dehydratase [Rubrivivax sp.]|jgi:4a-hydroxytetrahydrobiopterin dehydratase
MSAPQRLTDAQVAAELLTLPQWRRSDDGLGIERRYDFDDFVQAFGFMAQMAMVSETMNHHPEWSNVYRHVTVRMSTHDAGGLTALDVQWARRADALAGR